MWYLYSHQSDLPLSGSVVILTRTAHIAGGGGKTKNKKEKRVICFAQSGSPSKFSSEDCVVFVFLWRFVCVLFFLCVLLFCFVFFRWVVFCIFVFCFLFACFCLTPNWPSVRDYQQVEGGSINWETLTDKCFSHYCLRHRITVRQIIV